MNATTGHSGFVHSGLQSPRASGSAIRNPHGTEGPQSPRDRGSAIPTGPRVRNLFAGFTLIELMVSIIILTAIILIVSTLLDNAQRAVKVSQGTIVADADARAVVERIRADLAGLTTEGFLAIYTDTDDRPHLVFTAAGVYRSMIDSTIANAARIDYGLDGSADKNVLWRRAFLLNAEIATITDDDHEKISLADYKVWNRSDIDFTLYNGAAPAGQYDWPVGSGIMFDCFTNTPSMTLPPNSLADLENIWPYLARPCTDLKIDWADGTLDAGKMLVWYNSDAPKAGWAGQVAADDVVEYCNLVGKYCALWTYEKKDNWPSALRITFTLGTGETAQTYEVIVALPR